jgi:hypothetical protein
MKSLTPKQIVDLKPCEGYNLEQVTELFDNKKSVTYLEILDTDKVPLEDIVWLFCQPNVLSTNIKKQWMEVIVTRAVTNYALNCGIDNVEEWAKNWLSGKDKTFNAARNAADAAHAAAHATYTVVRTAYAACAACIITCAAARAAAARATAAALDIEYKQQIQDLKDILQGK